MRLFIKAILAVIVCTPAFSLTITPTGGSQSGGYSIGSTVPIQWDGEPLADNVDVLLWDGYSSVYTPISLATAWTENGVYWKVPGTVTPGNRYRFVVRDPANHKRFQMSAGWVQLGFAVPTEAREEGPDKGLDVQVHPFPAQSAAVVSWFNRNIENLHVVDLHNKVLLEIIVPHGVQSTTVDIRGISSGLVFIKLIDANGSVASAPLMITH